VNAPAAVVPLVDLKGWSHADDRGRRSVAARLDAALSEVGFVEVTGHRLPPEVLAAALRATDAFFALPGADKLVLRTPPEVNRGYSPLGSESLAYTLGETSRPPDLFEAFTIGTEEGPAEPPPPLPVFAPNVWPADLPELRPALSAYLRAAARVEDLLLEVCAVALGLPPRWFADVTRHPTRTLRCLRYERAAGAPEPSPGQLRLGEHSDYGLLTVLYADPVPGLQVLAADGQWLPVTPAAGTLVVNTGDLLARWTNDRWRSTVHRVVPPPAAADGTALRRSLAFFDDADHDAVVACLPTCTSAADPPRYVPVVAGEHLAAKLLAGRTSTPTSTGDTLGERRAALASCAPASCAPASSALASSALAAGAGGGGP